MGLCRFKFLWCPLLDIALYGNKKCILTKKLLDAEIHPNETSSYTSMEMPEFFFFFCLIQDCLLQDSCFKKLANGGKVQGNTAF